MTTWAPLLPLMVFPGLVIMAAVRDTTSFTIPNWISIAAVLTFLPVALWVSTPLGSLIGAAMVGVGFLVVGIAMFAFGWIGGGDAKLLAACALWLGWPAILPFLLWTAAAGGALALLLLWSRGLARFFPGLGPAWFSRLMQPKGDVPYGVAIAVGALAAFPSSALLHAAL